MNGVSADPDGFGGFKPVPLNNMLILTAVDELPSPTGNLFSILRSCLAAFELPETIVGSFLIQVLRLSKHPETITQNAQLTKIMWMNRFCHFMIIQLSLV